jgi:hypothetical protein
MFQPVLHLRDTKYERKFLIFAFQYKQFNVCTMHIRRNRNDQQYALIVQILCPIYWLVHVSAVACHLQGTS